MSCFPRFQVQLGRGSPTERFDCGPRTVQMGIDALTCGQLRPTIPEIRKRMGAPGAQPTTVYHAERCVESYDHIPHRHPLVYRILRTTAEVKEAVGNEHPVQVAISYRDYNRTGNTGDPNFMGGHSILVLGQRKAMGHEIQWHVLDPLNDGRRTGIPHGPRWIDRGRVVSAMEAFSPGTVFAGVFTGGAKRG